MKANIILIVCITLVTCTAVYAQEPPETPPAQTPAPTPAREKLQAYKMGYITHQLDLTPQEAEKFWPVFNQYQKEVNQVYQDKVAAGKNGSSVNTQIDYDQKMVDIRKKYYEEFKKVLPAAKVLKLYKAEHDFKVHVIRQVAARRNAAATRHNPAPRPHIRPGIK